MDTKNRYALITNDVETTSILNHQLSTKTGEYVLRQGMPRLMELYEKYGVRATFFFNGDIVKTHPEVVKIAQEYGHEIGSHGLSHEPHLAFDRLSLENQIIHLNESKKILEDICGEEIISFRAPAARVNKDTATALIETGFKIDSSVASQRLDMFFSFGIENKLNWIKTPRKPYFTKANNIFKKGTSDLLEIPISAFIFPYIGTLMRISPILNRLTRSLLYLETKVNNRPFVFLTHPNEFIDEEKETVIIQRRAESYFSYIMGDLIRHKLKVRNLGKKALPILERELIFFKNKNFKFATCKEIYELKVKEYASKRST